MNVESLASNLEILMVSLNSEFKLNSNEHLVRYLSIINDAKDYCAYNNAFVYSNYPDNRIDLDKLTLAIEQELAKREVLEVLAQ